MEFEKFILALFIIGWIVAGGLIVIPQLLWHEKATLIPTEAHPEIVNGILTVTGIIFGFQFAFLKAPKGNVRIIWVVALLMQVFSIAFVGWNYVSDTMSYGYLTTSTLLNAYSCLAVIVLFTVILASLEWMFFSK